MENINSNYKDSFHVTISDAIPVTDEYGQEVLLDQFYYQFKLILEGKVQGVDSSKGKVKSIIIRVYTTEMPNTTTRKIEQKQRFQKELLSKLSGELHDTPPPKLPAALKIRNRRIVESVASEAADRIEKAASRGFITRLKQEGPVGKLRPYLVADIETVLDNENKHLPYAAGVMRVDPAKGLPSKGSI